MGEVASLPRSLTTIFHSKIKVDKINVIFTVHNKKLIELISVHKEVKYIVLKKIPLLHFEYQKRNFIRCIYKSPQKFR